MPGSNISMQINDNPYGLNEVYSAQSPLVDIVFVHGLNGHPYNTWSTSKPDLFWPVDLLPNALEEQRVRILTYGYNADVTAFTDGTSKDKIHNHAEHLAGQLSANRSLKKATERPIIFVCHSLGGLVVKRCLIYCRNVRHVHTDRLRSIYVSTYGILFLGTPHNGSDLAKWGIMLQSICSAVLPKKFFDTSPQLVQALKTNNETLQNINRLFIEIIGRFRIYFFHESKPMDLKGTRGFVVDEDSAAPVIEGVERMGIEKDHSHMCKFESENAPGYMVVAEAIQRYSEESVSLIATRWIEEKQIRGLERREAAREMLGDSMNMDFSSGQGTPTPAHTSAQASLGNSVISVIEFEPQLSIENPPGPLLVAPAGFRPNSLFFGFDQELKRIDAALHDELRREKGSCSILVHGPAGSGKTHLVRQYLWLHKSTYLGGIFWVDARSEESRLKSYWDIAQAAALIEGSDITNEAFADGQGFVDVVRKWLESREGWLMVFDGITFDSEDRLHTMMKFIPDRRGNDIIFTSVDRNLAKRQRLLYPEAVAVQPLSESDAMHLLYSGIGITSPTSKQEGSAKDIVNHFECLPLAIHATAHRISARGKALEKFHISSNTTDRRLAEPYIGIIKDLEDFQHIEAINLINLLSFFEHQIPVAMIYLGRKALSDSNVEIRAIDRPGSFKRDLDETIAILIRYGLVDRLLQKYRVTTRSLKAKGPSDDKSTSETSSHDDFDNPPNLDSSSHSSTSSTSYTIDVLRVHTVVQGFCRDELRDRGLLQWWLPIAVRFLCLSYRTANSKIKGGDGEALTRDYREYHSQASRLRTYFPHKADISSNTMHQARHDLRHLMRSIRNEIEQGSPVQSFRSDRETVQISIFDRSSSTSSDGPTTPSSSPSRASTWDRLSPTVTESPMEIHNVSRQVRLTVPPGLPYDRGYDTDMDIAGGTFESSTVSPTTSEDTENGLLLGSRRGSTTLMAPDYYLRHIFKGRNSRINDRDLGDWHPLPPQAILTPVAATADSPMRPRTISFGDSLASAGSEAEAALAAVHRVSPPSSRGRGPRSLSRPRLSGEARSPTWIQAMTRRYSTSGVKEAISDHVQDPSRGRAMGLSTSPLSNLFTFDNSAGHHAHEGNRSDTSSDFYHDSKTTLPPLPIDENISITAATPRSSTQAPTGSATWKAPLAAQQHSAPSFILEDNEETPSCYKSTPMSRDISAESKMSQVSQISEPARNKPSFPPTKGSLGDVEAADVTANARTVSPPGLGIGLLQETTASSMSLQTQSQQTISQKAPTSPRRNSTSKLQENLPPVSDEPKH